MEHPAADSREGFHPNQEQMTKTMNAMNKRQEEKMMTNATLAVIAWTVCAIIYCWML